jgi:MFS family permease
MAALWLVSDWFPYLVAVQILAGIMWGAWELATFLLVFEAIREEERTSILTTFNAVAMVAGSLVGGAILHHLGEEKIGYMTIFALSSCVRVLTLPLLRRVPDVRLLARPIATRTVALRAGDAASDDRPVLPSIDDERTPGRENKKS